jgi:hypothetical protein
MMPQIVDAWACRPGWDDYVQGGHDVIVEGVTNRIGMHRLAPAPREERRARVRATVARPAREIRAQDGCQPWSEWHLSTLPELAVANE